MSYVGDFALGSTFDVKFTTVNTSGAPTTLAGSPVVSAYVDNNVTELTAGITLTVDFDSRTGMHNVRVVATSGNGYASGGNYQLVLTAGTVGGTSVVGYVVAQFSIEARSALRPATAGRTLVVDAAGLADANAVKVGPTGSGTAQTARDLGASVLLSSGTGTGQLDFTSGVVKANLAQILGTAITETAGQIAAAFKQFFDVASPTGTMKAITNVVTATNLTTNNDKTGYALSSAGVQAIWDALSSALSTAGSIGKRLVDFITGDIYARIGAPAGASIAADLVTITNYVDSLETRIPATLTEPVAPPAGTATIAAALSWLNACARGKLTSTATQLKVHDDAGVVVGTSALSDDGTTATRDEFA